MKALGISVLALAFSLPAHVASGHGIDSHHISIRDAVGQPVYDLTGTKVGSIRGIVSIKGREVVSVAPGRAFGPGDLLVTMNYLQPRAEGGWLVALSDSSIGYLRLYETGQGLPPDFSS